MKQSWDKEWQGSGFFIVRDLLSDERCDEIIEASYGLPSYRDDTFTPCMQPHLVDEAFFYAMCNPDIVSIMEYLVGGKVSGLQTQFFFGRPGTIGFNKHQDNFYARAGYGLYASAWLALNDTDPENGGLIVYPGSHKEDLLRIQNVRAESSLGQDPNALAKQIEVPEKYSPVDVVAPKGSVVFIHGHIIHNSHTNSSARWRPVLLITYLKKGSKFRPGYSAKRKEVDVYG